MSAPARVTRLISLVLLLQERHLVTAPVLADELGVSERTIARDIAALGEAGVPVYAAQGRDGGYRLLDGFRTRLAGLDRTEVEALFLSGAPDALRELGFDKAAVAARVKVAAVLAPSARQAPDRVRQRFHLDAPGWFQQRHTPPWLSELSAAVWGDSEVRVEYQAGQRLSADTSPRPVSRTLWPYGLVLKAGIWYLVASCGGDFRVYRVDRVRQVEATGEVFDRGDFDLESFWKQRAEQFALSMLRVPVRVRLSPRGRRRLPGAVEEHAAERARQLMSDEDDNGWAETIVWMETIEVGEEELLRLGPEVEVVDPPELRQRMADAARRTLALYDAR